MIFFEQLDAILLARIQFAFTIAFHIIFPSFSIGLASFLAVIEGRYYFSKSPQKRKLYKEIFDFWIKVFAVVFAMGVVSGVTMSYQIGTNWAGFSDKIGNIVGPLMGYEVLTAFFLEASFLGIMLFGWNRVSDKMHFAATIVVAVGTVISAFWILSVNSWMQTPDGYRLGEDGLYYATDWLKVIFNPSFGYRLLHMIIAAYLTTAFVIGGTAAYYLIKNRHTEHAKLMFGMAMIMALFVAPTQLFVGDLHGLNSFKYQPAKVAAMEGIWENEEGAALRLFAIPDENTESNKYEISIPNITSLILTHHWDGPKSEVKGLKNWPKDERPPVSWVFFSFRIMVAIGIAMILTGLIAAFLFYKGQLFTHTLFHRWCVLLSPAGFIAILAGWFVTEIGRQPYVVYGLLKTSDAVSNAILAPQVAWSLLAFIVVYLFTFGAALFYILRHLKRGINWSGMQPVGSHGVKKPVLISELGKIKKHEGDN